MGNVHMEASQINYRGGNTKMSVEEAIKNAGNTGLAHMADIAPEFSTEAAYNAGDIVYHNGSLYEFTANHAAGAWSTSDTQAATVGGKIESLEGDVASLSSAKANQITIAPTFSVETTYDPGDLVYYNGATYRCVNAHEGAWDADDFAATSIDGELSSLRSGLNNLTQVKYFDVAVTSGAASYDYTNDTPSDYVMAISAISVGGRGVTVAQLSTTAKTLYFVAALDANTTIRIAYIAS